MSFCRSDFTLSFMKFSQFYFRDREIEKNTVSISVKEVDLDSSLHSPLTPELHHACSMVLFSGPYLCVHLCLTFIPAQLASFQQKRAKGDTAGASKKTQKRKGQAVTQIHSTTQDCPVKSDLCQAGDANLIKTNHEVCSSL